MHRITINPEQCGGRPCIRGMRIRVIDILDLFAVGLSAEQILEEMPDLEREDLQAALQYAARRLDHPVLTPQSASIELKALLKVTQALPQVQSLSEDDIQREVETRRSDQ